VLEVINFVKVCYRLSSLRGIAQTRRDEILPSVGILCGAIPAPAITSPVRPKKYVGLLFGDLLLVN
jgi:hypothetical protein